MVAICAAEGRGCGWCWPRPEDQGGGRVHRDHQLDDQVIVAAHAWGNKGQARCRQDGDGEHLRSEDLVADADGAAKQGDGDHARRFRHGVHG